ncbi:hypothetical protein LCM08_10840 [Salipiger pacificus]|nr:hypothetical protein [Alloyangia pacifica]
MVSSSKILTVSYGTFSCTAEGFEDPLGVVKDTTQFFRGVVREDRFFGAEPPQFDPELAAQLLQAQLDAEAQGGRLVLRGPLADVATPVSHSPAPSVAPSVAQPAAEVIGPDADRGMEAALAETAARAAAEAEAAEAEELAESAEPESDLPAVDSLAAEAAFFAAEAGQAAGDDYDYEESAFDVAAAPAPRAVPLEEAQDEAADSVAAKLRRIRAVVSGGAAASAVAAQDEADQDDSALEGADTVAAVSAMLGSLASDEPAPAAPEVEADEDTLAASLIEAVMTSEEEDVVAEAAPAPAPLALTSEFAAKPEALAEAQPAEQRRSPRRVRVVKVTRAAFDAAVASGQLEQIDEPKPSSSLSAEDEAELARELEAVKAELAAGLESEWDEVEDLDALSTAPAAEIPAEAEQVLADIEAENAEGAPAETAGDDEDWDDEDWDDEDWDDEAWDDEDLDDTSWESEEDAEAAELDDEDEDEVEPEVAEYDDEDEDDYDAEDAAAFAAAFDEAPEAQGADQQEDDLEDAIARMAHEDVRKAVKLSSPARVMLTEQSVEDNDTSRILDETNTQMEEPEGNRRRSAIAHLRAAVAATRADRLLGRKKDAEAQTQPYREDLADVVRPRRPAAPARSERAAEASVETSIDPRPAPLKLVAEQRVNLTAEAAATPLRPRRVTLADFDAADADASSDFADYADSVGAHDLPELLEAAAAYLSYVEGREQFSRPQLMTKVRQVEGQDSSREDRLRSFGQLLRDGKIEKTGGGRFTVSERISFKPSARAAG